MDKEPRIKSPKATDQEIDERIEFVAIMLGEGRRMGEIKKAVLERWGIGYRQAEEYASRAREELRKKYAASLDTHRADSFAFYLTKRSDPSVPPIAQIRASERLDALLGLDAPNRVAIGGDQNGAPLQITGVIVELPAKRRLGEPPVEIRNGHPNGNGNGNGHH